MKMLLAEYSLITASSTTFYGKQPEVVLSDEAYFEVAKNKGKTFMSL